MEIQGYGVVEARPTYAHVGYLSAQALQFIDSTPRPAYLANVSVVMFAACLGCAALAFRRRLGQARRVGFALLAVLMAWGGWQARRSFTDWRSYYGPPTREAFATLVTLERLTAEADRELGGAPPGEAWLEAWRSRSLVDGWGTPLSITEGGLSADIAPWQDGRNYVIASVSYEVETVCGRHPALTSWMLGRDGRFGTTDDRETMRWLAKDARIDPKLNDPDVLKKLARRVRR